VEANTDRAWGRKTVKDEVLAVFRELGEASKAGGIVRESTSLATVEVVNLRSALVSQACTLSRTVLPMSMSKATAPAAYHWLLQQSIDCAECQGFRYRPER